MNFRKNMLQGVYYVQNVEVNVEKLPPFFPEKNGLFNVVVMDKKEPLFGIHAFFETKTFEKN